MFFKTLMQPSTETFSKQIDRLKGALDTADAVVIGAGAGLSASAGLTYTGERFEKYFSDFIERYGIQDMYTGGFYPFQTMEEHWAWWSRQIMVNRYKKAPKPVYDELLALVKDKNYFVLTTNVDHQFQLAGFDKKRLFYTQGDYGLWQCSKPCHWKTYDNEETVRRMVREQKDGKVPGELVPRCPRCGRPMTMNLRCDDTFVQDEGWYAAAERYETFLHDCAEKRVLFLELGVGMNTPAIIKYPFWSMTYENKNAVYACLNQTILCIPQEIQTRSICIAEDIKIVLEQLLPNQSKAAKDKMES